MIKTPVQENIHTTDILLKITASQICSLDVEYDPTTTYLDDGFQLHGMGVSWITPNGHIEGIYIRNKEDIQKILDFVGSMQIPVVGHYFLSDILAFMGAGYTFKQDLRIYSTEIAVNLIYEEWNDFDLGLKQVVPKLLGKSMTKFEEVSDDMDSPEFVAYAVDDVVKQLELYKFCEPQLQQLKLIQPFNIICGSIHTFAEMLFEGIPIDLDVAEELFERLQMIQDDVKDQVQRTLGNIDINSPQQLSRSLFKERGFHRGIDLQKSDKTGEIGTGEGNMKKLAEKHPVCELIMVYRSCVKAIGTYLNPLVESAIFRNGKYHDYFFLTSKTGRLRAKYIVTLPKNGSMGTGVKFNEDLVKYLKDIKIRSIIKPGIIDGEEWVVISVDYASLEYRWAALNANDRKMITMYRTCECEDCGEVYESDIPQHFCQKCKSQNIKHGQDLHQDVCDTANEQGAGINRNKAKNVSFCTVFYGTAGRLSQMLGLPKALCQNILDSVKKRFPGIPHWHEQTRLAVLDGKAVYGKLGRRRKVNLKQRLADGKKEDEWWITKNAVNECINAPVQSDGNLLSHLGVQRVRKILKERGYYGKDAKLILYAHDEVCAIAKKDVAEDVAKTMQYAFETAITCEMPFASEYSIGASYAEAK